MSANSVPEPSAVYDMAVDTAENILGLPRGALRSGRQPLLTLPLPKRNASASSSGRERSPA